MEREIAFRGKSKSTGEWVDGYYVGDNTIIAYNEVVYDLGFIDISPCHDCYPGSIGQFTGLYDKNGKEIYEGDIIRSFDSSGDAILHYIVWEEARFVALYKGRYFRSKCFLGQDWLDEFDKEVIGNIHDNPELLKDGRD